MKIKFFGWLEIDKLLCSENIYECLSQQGFSYPEIPLSISGIKIEVAKYLPENTVVTSKNIISKLKQGENQ